MTCWLASNERAARSSEPRSAPVRQRLLEPHPERRHRLLEHGRTGARREVPDRAPAARGRGTSRPASSPRRSSPHRRRAAGPGRRAARPRPAGAPSAGAPCSRRRPSTPPRPSQPGRGRDRAVRLLQRVGHRLVALLDVTQPPLEALVDGHLERLVGDEVLQPRARPGRVDQPDDAGLVGGQRLLAARRPGRGRGRRSSAAPAARATPRRSRAPSPVPPSAAGVPSSDGAVARPSAARSPTARTRAAPPGRARRPAPRTAGHEGAAARAVARLVALARPARARLARTDLALGDAVARLGA